MKSVKSAKIIYEISDTCKNLYNKFGRLLKMLPTPALDTHKLDKLVDHHFASRLYNTTIDKKNICIFVLFQKMLKCVLYFIVHTFIFNACDFLPVSFCILLIRI